MNNISKTIEWAEKSWNPVSGCMYNCWYCYARKIANRFKQSFEPTFHQEKLNEPERLSKSSRIFVCSNSDLFGDWVDPDHIQQVIDITKRANRHEYFFLTKNPARYLQFKFPDNCWLGCTITGAGDMDRLDVMRQIVRWKKFVSFEPILKEIDFKLADIYSFSWAIFGKLNYHKSDINWPDIQQQVLKLRWYEIPIFIKQGSEHLLGNYKHRP